MLPRAALRPRKRNAPRPSHKVAHGFLAWLRGRPCFLEWTGDCAGRMEAAHTYGAGDKGVGTKSSDRYAIPLCSAHHAEQHRVGWRTFETTHGFDAPRTAEKYWRAWPGRSAWLERNGDA